MAAGAQSWAEELECPFSEDMMKRITWSLLCALIVSIFGLFTTGALHAFSPCRPGYYPPTQPPRSVQRTVNVNVPVQSPLPPTYSLPRGCGIRPCPPVKPSTVPVRVNVAVTPTYPLRQKMVPVVYCSPGPIRPVVTNAVGLAGALVAAPFRVADMFLPVYCPGMYQKRQQCGPPRAMRGPFGYRGAAQPMCVPPLRKCAIVGPPPCPPPMACAPSGASVSPLPRPLGPQPCRPHIPPRVVEDCDYPIVETRGILAGIVNLPFRLIQRGRIFGDMNRVPPGSPCVR